ncbi:hypothetical protein [Nitratifractor sp.]
MNDYSDEELLRRIEELMAYGETPPTIEPSLLRYLDRDSLLEIIRKLEKRQENLIDEEKEWLKQFRKEE